MSSCYHYRSGAAVGFGLWVNLIQVIPQPVFLASNSRYSLPWNSLIAVFVSERNLGKSILVEAEMPLHQKIELGRVVAAL